MKSNLKYILLFLMPVFLGGVMQSCSEDEAAESDGDPVINYVRVTEPAKSDSLLESAFMGNLVAIIGENLDNVKEVWFNDQKAILNPNYVTDRSIILNVPNVPPSEVTDVMKLVTKSGKVYEHPFSVNIPAPVVATIKSEYVPTGETAVIEGDFFFEPLAVIFPGGVEGEIVSVEKTKVEVVVPEGAESGEITVETNFGATESDFVFRDQTGLIVDFDTYMHENWTAPLAGTPENPGLVSPVDGAYAYFEGDKTEAWKWTNELTMQYHAPNGKGDVPFATGAPSDYVFKFEANVPKEWTDLRMEIILTVYGKGDGRGHADAVHYRWEPWKDGAFKTDGWVTVSIPLSEFKGPIDGGTDALGDNKVDFNIARNLTMMMFGPAEKADPFYVAIDNPRIVRK